MAEEVKQLVEAYRDGKISRRDFMRRMVVLTGSIAAATTLTNSFLASHSAAANQVDPNDPSLASKEVTYEGNAGKISGYLTQPKARGNYPGVVVVHENRGINDHIRDVARRLAKQGYVVVAPDYLSRKGGTMKVNPKGGGIKGMRKIAPVAEVVQDTESSIAYLRTLPNVNKGAVAMVGFCWGGEMTFAAATKIKDLKAAIVYYGRSPKNLDDVKDIVAPVLAHYGGNDKGVNKGIPATIEAMKKYGKTYDHKIYAGAGHAFNNDTRSDRHNPEASRMAWKRTLAFLKKNLT